MYAVVRGQSAADPSSYNAYTESLRAHYSPLACHLAKIVVVEPAESAWILGKKDEYIER